MSASDYDLRKKFLEAVGKLLDLLPSSVPSLVKILDKLFLCLGEVEQDPSSSIKEALSPMKEALAAERLFKHSNVHVRVAVASCLMAVIRITAPNAPYNDDKMREVFRLIVSSFEQLADKSCRSYTKRTSILETVARTRVPVVMLDIGCDELIIEMFQHFLKCLRDNHPMEVSSYMENIMTTVLEESEDISPGLLSPILLYVKNDDKIPQVSRRLAEKVLINCGSKLKTYLNEAVKSSGVSLHKYSDVVASICEGTFFGLKQNEVVSQQDTHKVAEVSNPEQTEAQTHKRARDESCSGMEKTAATAEPRDSQPCSVTHQLAKVKQSIVDAINSVRQFRSELETKEQSIVDTLTSVRQFRSELKRKEDNLEASLLEVDILGEKILGINKILNS